MQTLEEKKEIPPDIKVGDVFGVWKVIRGLRISKSRNYTYLCQCVNCGTKKEITKANILNGVRTKICKNCGVNHAGERINEWEILERTQGKSNSRNNLWRCRCALCGNIKIFPSNYFHRSVSMPKCECRKNISFKTRGLSPQTIKWDYKSVS